MGLKRRIIPVLLWDEHGAVKGKQFSPGRRIGSMMDRVRLLERRGIDELIILDISATPNKRSPRFEEAQRLCENLFCPVTIGGGIKNIADIRRLLAGGADKVAINSACEVPGFIEEAARKFGSQAIVVSIDVGFDGYGYTCCGVRCTNADPVDLAEAAEANGAGEILLNSIERDGMMQGYDLDLIERVSSAVDIPVIAMGGCGEYQHMIDAINAGAHAVASGAMFQFCEATPKGAARYLSDHGIPARL